MPDDIATFESGGITCEWDEAAISTALLLEMAWKDDPHCALPESLGRPAPDVQDPRPAPDFGTVAHALTTPNLLSVHPLERAERYFFAAHSFTPSQSAILLELIRGARDPRRSLTHRTFQELVLGSEEFARTYHLPAELDTESHLLKYDRSGLSASESARLRDWTSMPDHAAVIITSRPSRAPAGIFSTPEAELGAALVGLDGIPILGWGGLVWLGQQRQADPQTFLKPSPVHALAALRMALGDDQETALSAAVELGETGNDHEAWEELDSAQVSVFEDTPGGIRSLQAAAQILDTMGIYLETKYYGIAQNPVKIEALHANQAQTFPALAEALKNADCG